MHFEGYRYGMKRVDACGHGPVLDLRQVSPADLGHISELRLRETTLFPDKADLSA